MVIWWLLFGVASLVLIGALMVGWEALRGAPARTEPRARVGAAAGLYLLNQGLIAPLLAVGLATIGTLVHPEKRATSPGITEIAVGFVTFEAVTYLLHRLAHRIPLLFRLHRVHHDGDDLGWIDAFRQHPIEFAMFQGLGNLPAVILFGPLGHVSLWLNIGLRLWTAWLHARGPVELGALEHVLTSPAMHHLHHRKRRPGEDRSTSPTCNYGGILSVFDWLGGTVIRRAQPAAADDRVAT
ncbi:Putative sterol desaturase [Minicystis rosea]|nr:Putative sterol desaturase [Minicystis rosea]